ncbi:MAG: hypothetical protein PHC90_04845 [Syntrophorhabdaceae bacterium]|nr:hypothetical protein [Syntrophorhabdaceae bacterium]
MGLFDDPLLANPLLDRLAHNAHQTFIEGKTYWKRMSRTRRRNSMKRNTILKIMNPILGILLVNQIATGIFRDFLPDEAFEIMHERGGPAFAVVAILHVILNWGWAKASFFKSSPAAKSWVQGRRDGPKNRSNQGLHSMSLFTARVNPVVTPLFYPAILKSFIQARSFGSKRSRHFLMVVGIIKQFLRLSSGFRRPLITMVALQLQHGATEWPHSLTTPLKT